MDHEDPLQTLNDFLRCSGMHNLNFIISAKNNLLRPTPSHLTVKDLASPRPSLAKDLVARGSS